MSDHRLRKTSHVQWLYRHGIPVRSAHLGWYWHPNTRVDDRWVIVISTKISKRSTVRNRLRRILKEACRAWSQQSRVDRPRALDIVIVVRKRPAEESIILSECRQSLERIHESSRIDRLASAPQRRSFGSTRTRFRGTIGGVSSSAAAGPAATGHRVRST